MAQARVLNRLGCLLRSLEAAPSLDEVRLARTMRRATRLWSDLFEADRGVACGPVLPVGAALPAVFRPCPDARHDAPGALAWQVAQAGLFLHYAPVAGRLLAVGSQPGERAATLLLADALRMLRDHAAASGQSPERYDALLVPAPPFARLVHCAPRLRSHRSSDVNLGAVALALAVESGFRDALELDAEARLSMWRLFRALDETAASLRLGIDLPVLVAVYNWASRHRRAGQRGFGWLNYFAADLLHPLFAPEAPLDFGLQAEPDTLAQLRAAAAG